MYAADLVSLPKEVISISLLPRNQAHPSSAQADLLNLKRKVEAGSQPRDHPVLLRCGCHRVFGDRGVSAGIIDRKLFRYPAGIQSLKQAKKPGGYDQRSYPGDVEMFEGLDNDAETVSWWGYHRYGHGEDFKSGR